MKQGKWWATALEQTNSVSFPSHELSCVLLLSSLIASHISRFDSVSQKADF